MLSRSVSCNATFGGSKTHPSLLRLELQTEQYTLPQFLYRQDIATTVAKRPVDANARAVHLDQSPGDVADSPELLPDRLRANRVESEQRLHRRQFDVAACVDHDSEDVLSPTRRGDPRHRLGQQDRFGIGIEL
jgi:hypothetical protein